MSPHCVWIITAGGGVDKSTPVTDPNIAMLTELGQCSIYIIISLKIRHHCFGADNFHNKILDIKRK